MKVSRLLIISAASLIFLSSCNNEGNNKETTITPTPTTTVVTTSIEENIEIEMTINKSKIFVGEAVLVEVNVKGSQKEPELKVINKEIKANISKLEKGKYTVSIDESVVNGGYLDIEASLDDVSTKQTIVVYPNISSTVKLPDEGAVFSVFEGQEEATDYSGNKITNASFKFVKNELEDKSFYEAELVLNENKYEYFGVFYSFNEVTLRPTDREANLPQIKAKYFAPSDARDYIQISLGNDKFISLGNSSWEEPTDPLVATVSIVSSAADALSELKINQEYLFFVVSKDAEGNTLPFANLDITLVEKDGKDFVNIEKTSNLSNSFKVTVSEEGAGQSFTLVATVSQDDNVKSVEKTYKIEEASSVVSLPSELFETTWLFENEEYSYQIIIDSTGGIIFSEYSIDYDEESDWLADEISVDLNDEIYTVSFELVDDGDVGYMSQFDEFDVISFEYELDADTINVSLESISEEYTFALVN